MTKNDLAAKGQVNTNAAEVYEEFFVPALFGEWPPRAIKVAAIKPGHKVLDVACGTGVVARKVAATLGSSDSVVGVDINDGMLAVASRIAPEIKWVSAPAEKLPFDDNSFDAIICQFALMFFEDRNKAIREMYRVLKPGGRMVTIVWDSLDNTPGYRDMVALIDQVCGTETADALRAPFVLGDVEILRAIFEKAGLPSVEISTVAGTAQFPSVAEWLKTDVKGWTLRDLIDDEQYALLQSEAPSHLAKHVGSDGRVSFASPAHVIVAQK